MTQCPSSRRAVVLVAPASVPPPASVSPNAPSALPLAKQRQPLLLLVLVAEAVHRHRAQRHAGLQRDRHALVDLAEFLERQAQREVVAAHAAVLLGERQPEQAHVGHARRPPRRGRSALRRVWRRRARRRSARSRAPSWRAARSRRAACRWTDSQSWLCSSSLLSRCCGDPGQRLAHLDLVADGDE